MNRIEKTFIGNKALIAFLMGGDPSPASSESFAISMLEAGADMIMVGIPFSDPAAEGPAGQAAHLRAIASGAKTGDLIRLAGRIRRKTDRPILLQSYLNPLFCYGYQAFFSDCEEAGLDGLVILDLPHEERAEVLPFAKQHKIALISVLAPSLGRRARDIVRDAEGFVYVKTPVNPGEAVHFLEEAARLISLPAVTDLPGNQEKQAACLVQAADGIIFSALELIGTCGDRAGHPLSRTVNRLKRAGGL
jgi:tryptophan synthase alpha chain